MSFLNTEGLERFWQHVVLRLGTKVDKVEGKGLSTEDFTTEEKEKLATLANGGTGNLSDGSGTGSISQLTDLDEVADGLDFTVKNPNAVALFNALPETSPVRQALPDGIELVTEQGSIGDYSQSLGGSSVSLGKRASATGQTTLAIGIYSHTEGDNTVTMGDASHAEGYKTTAYGNDSHAEGNETTAKGNSSHSEGYGTKALGENSHAEGALSEAIGNLSHAEGHGAKAEGYAAHSEGYMTEAKGGSSHAEGSNTHATSDGAHAEGISTTASHQGAHAEGYSTEATGPKAHAEGHTTHATGEGSHAEGHGTTASGMWSHAEGYLTNANGFASHASGNQTIAAQSGQFVVGQLNDNKADTLFEIGNGIAARSNAFEVYSDGSISLDNGVTKLSPANIKAVVDFIDSDVTLAQNGLSIYYCSFPYSTDKEVPAGQTFFVSAGGLTIPDGRAIQVGDLIIDSLHNIYRVGLLYEDSGCFDVVSLGVNLNGADGLSIYTGKIDYLNAGTSLLPSTVVNLVDGRALQIGDLIVDVNGAVVKVKEIYTGAFLFEDTGIKLSGTQGEQGNFIIPVGVDVPTITQQTADIIAQGPWHLPDGYNLRVGDICIGTNGYIARISAINSTTVTVIGTGIGINNGGNSTSGVTGLGIYTSTEKFLGNSELMPNAVISIPTDRQLQIGDLIITSDGVLARVTWCDATTSFWEDTGIKLNTGTSSGIYIQDTIPEDAPIGAIWIDTSTTSIGSVKGVAF